MSPINNHHQSQYITRRDFLLLSSLGLISAFSPRFTHSALASQAIKNVTTSHNPFYKTDIFDSTSSLNPNQQGRVLNPSADVFGLPSIASSKIKKYWRDTILPISGITVGESESSYNTIWYKVGNEGYIHSSDLQPVLTITNTVVNTIPNGGSPAEVTVPFTDARWDPGFDKPVAYRFYYATTYWVMEFLQDEQGNAWYGLRDDKWDYMFYVPASHLRLIPSSELKPISGDIPSYQKRIEVHLPEQVMIAFEYDQPVFMARVATGAKFSNGDFSTPPGTYITFHKRSSRHMARGNLAANGYDLPGVPWNSYITEEGIAIHGTYWHNSFGMPRSHGCINLTPQAAKWVYLWTLPRVPANQEFLYEDYGTTVDVFG